MSPPEISVRIPTQSSPSRIQTITGRLSPVSSAVEEFRGIPYASIPGRWQHSILRRDLPSDNFDATHNGPKCPQPPGPNNSDTFQAHLDFPSDVTESEFDCCNLFIQRPSPAALKRIGKENTPLPVFVWIHGGGFGFGAATDPMWDPTRLVLRSIALGTPIITASINYRLSVFGFLGTSSLLPSNPQGLNFGLQDQHQALRWLYTNISSFGGDASQIIIAGQSAGGASIHAHILNARKSLENPLFRRAVCMSGTIEVLGPCTLEKADGKWDILCEKVKVIGNEEEKVVNMKEKPAQELVDASWELGWMGFDSIFDDVSIISPVAEGVEMTVSFPRTGVEETGNEKQGIDVLIGETASEGSLWLAATLPHLTTYSQIYTIFQSTYPSNLASTSTSASEILSAYNLLPDTPLPLLHQNLIRFATDTTFTHASTRAATYLSRPYLPPHNRPVTVQQYHVRYGNPFPGPQSGVAHHCVDLIYLFEAFHSYLAGADEKEERGDKGTHKARDSNRELTHKVQGDWLEFITVDEVEMGKVIGGEKEEGSVRVYGHDRLVRDESLENEYWLEQRKRLEVLGRDPRAARKTLEMLMQA